MYIYIYIYTSSLSTHAAVFEFTLVRARPSRRASGRCVHGVFTAKSNSSLKIATVWNRPHCCSAAMPSLFCVLTLGLSIAAAGSTAPSCKGLASPWGQSHSPNMSTYIWIYPYIYIYYIFCLLKKQQQQLYIYIYIYISMYTYVRFKNTIIISIYIYIYICICMCFVSE